MPSRRRARELAFQMLYQWDVGQHSPAHVLASFLAGQRTEAAEESFARALFEGAVEKREVLDLEIRKCAQNWRLERMAAVDRSILRLALYEMLAYPETPAAVVINEALEIARRFSARDSVDFINGILDAIRKARATPAPDPAA
jgi:transcription antitermination protein NusB